MILSETWLSKTTSYNLDINGFDSFHLFGNRSRNARKGRYSGGISIYYKYELKNKISLIETNQIGIVWIKLCKSLFSFNEDVYICSVYKVPSNSPLNNEYDIDFFECLENSIERYNCIGKVIINGDFNSRTGTNDDFITFDHFLDNGDLYDLNEHIEPRKNHDNTLDTYGKRLLELCKTTGLLITNGRLNNGDYTFHSVNGCSTVDYILTEFDNFKYLKHCSVLHENEFSDHSPLQFCITKHCEQTRSRETKNNAEHFFKWDNSKANDFINEITVNQQALNEIYQNINGNSIEVSVQQFTMLMQTHALHIFGERSFPNKSTNKPMFKNKWFDLNCQNARKQFNNARNRFLRDKTDQNRQEYLTAKSNYNKIKRQAKYKYKRQEGERLTNLAKEKPRDFWKTIKNQYKKQQPTSTNLTVDEIYEHFNDLIGSFPNSENPEPEIPNILDENLDKEFTSTELRHAVFSQNNNKSPGTDYLPAEIFKSSYELIEPLLLKLFNTIFTSGNYPTSWGEGIITPIFKGGNIDDCKNYRGITLTNIIAKIYSQLLLNRLTKWSIEHETISDNQFGFQKGKSTSDCIFILHSLIYKTLKQHKKTLCSFSRLGKNV